MLRVAIVGAGLQGHRRAAALEGLASARVVAVSSRHPDDAAHLAARHQAQVTVDWAHAVEDDEVDAVLVCTPPDSHLEITMAAITAGKHVLCEKPMASSSDQARLMAAAARDAGVVLECGFNHRFHPAVRRVHDMVDGGELGAPVFFRCAYGIGGRPGYEREWRCDPAVVSGGHLVEQGIHAVDLAQWMFGAITEVTAACATSYWPIGPLEDNAVVLLRFGSGALGQVHASLTQWVNLFRMEVGFRDGVAVVDGLGGGYGDERLHVWRRTDGPFSAEIEVFRGADRSWSLEFEAFERRARTGGDGGAPDQHPGVSALRVVELAYAGDRERTWKSV